MKLSPSVPCLNAVRHPLTWLRLAAVALALFLFTPSALLSARFGLFTYQTVVTAGQTTVKITGYPTNAVGEVVIPSVIEGWPVTTLGQGAFHGCTGLTSVSIPSSITSIDISAFQECVGLTSVAIPNSLTRLNDSVFFGCTGLTSVTLPSSVTSIGYKAFQGCTGLTSVTIPDSVTDLHDYTFSGCTGLTSVTIPSSRTFSDNIYLRDVSV